MPDVLILVEAANADITVQMVAAFRQDFYPRFPGSQLQVLPLSDGMENRKLDKGELQAALVCPLTLDIPDWLAFPGQAIYRACRDVLGLR
ncbi:MAG: hypothetical protein WCA35_11570, partial [Kovacikia sp.]